MICRYLVTSTAFSDCIALRFRVGEVFRCEDTADGSNGKSRYAFRRWLRPWASTFFRASKMGISVAVIASTLALCSLVSAVRTCTKNGSPDREAQRSFTKREKELNSLIIRNY